MVYGISEVLPRVNTGAWDRKIYSPPETQRQIDGWACGLFVAMAIEALAGASAPDFSAAIDDKKDQTRKHMLESLLTLP